MRAAACWQPITGTQAHMHARHSPLIAAVVALIAHAHKSGWPHVRIADGALAVALFTQPANGCAINGEADHAARQWLCAIGNVYARCLLKPTTCGSMAAQKQQ